MTKPLAFFEGGEKGGVSTAWIVVWSLARSGGPNTHFGWGNCSRKLAGSASKSVNFPCDLTSLVCFWSGVISRGIQPSCNLRHAKFVLQNVLYSFSGDSYSISYQLNVCHPSQCGEHGQCFLKSVVALAERPDLGSSSRLSLPLLNSAALFLTVDKTGASSSNAAM